jgi:hypothetical protein
VVDESMFDEAGRTGPLVEGEARRNEEWGRELAERFGPSATPLPVHVTASKPTPPDNTEEEP